MTASPFDNLREATVLNPSTDKPCGALDGLLDENNNMNWMNIFSDKKEDSSKKYLVVLMPQLGDFDSVEYAELLASVKDDLKEEANIELRIIGIGTTDSTKRFANFVGIPADVMRVDPTGKIHKKLGVHGGPDWDIPSFVPPSVLQWFADYVGADISDDIVDEEKIDIQRDIARAWLNYMAMCAGIAAPKTLPEIFRGYVGDKNAPERLRSDDIIKVGDDFIVIKGITDVKLGPIQYQSLWKNEKGYQRPAELATIRLRAMVEILTNMNTYVPDQRYVHLRGTTYLFDNEGEILYKHRDTGVLAYSETMQRPLSFLQKYIGNKALNPLGLGDSSLE